MAQRLWRGMTLARICEVCGKSQFGRGGDWQPHVSPICVGDDNGGRRRARPRPFAPAGSPRVLEDAL